MRALVSECVRYFMLPYCFRMPADHIHTTRCWDEEFHRLREELGNVESDVRTLEIHAKGLQKELADARATISVLKGEATGQPRFRWGDHVVQAVQATDNFWMQQGEISVSDAVKAYQRQKPTPVHPEREDKITRFFSPTGQEMFGTPDGKRFMTMDAAVRHMKLLRKRP